jgi:hypothetical protein
MKFLRLATLALVTSSLALVSCGGGEEAAAPVEPAPPAKEPPAEKDDHHDEESLGTVRIGDLTVELAQSHGAVTAGHEGHLVVKLPYSDDGATVVRAWIGTEDRLSSYVGLGTYAPDHDDYDVHATAPDPLPANPRWWSELEKPDGSKLVGSALPILE